MILFIRLANLPDFVSRFSLSALTNGQTEGFTPSQIPPFNFFIVARTTIASLTQDNETLVAQLEELRPVKEQLDSLWIVLAVVTTIGFIF